MPKQSRENLRQTSLKASRIDQVLKMPGWNDIEIIIQAKYQSSLDDLLKGENAEARGAVNAINEIMNDISIELEFGKKALSKYKEQNLSIRIPEGE